MNFFKRRSVALFLTVIVVIASTLLSVNVKLGRKAQAVSDGFYDGVVYNGTEQKSIASQLRNISDCANSMVTIANNYQLDTEDVENTSEWLRLAVSYSPGNTDYIHSEYEDLIKAVRTLEDQLGRTALSDRDADSIKEYSTAITDARLAIESAGYNESVREFRRFCDRFPTKLLAQLSGVSMPRLFA